MKRIEFSVDGVMGKQRPRARFMKGHAVIYTPKETKDFEKKIAQAYLDAGGEKFDEDVPLRILVMIYHGIPKGTSKKKRELMLNQMVRPMKTPDPDNVIKIVADGIQGVAYDNDKQVVECEAKKFWDETDHMTIIVRDASL